MLGAALPLEAARAFYEELLQPDDLPEDPKPLLVEMIHKYTLMAENLPPELTPTFRKEYAVLIGLPFLPYEFVHWLKENLVMAAAVLHIKIDITILLYAEAWPVVQTDVRPRAGVLDLRRLFLQPAGENLPQGGALGHSSAEEGGSGPLEQP